jgi:hypothetical protein
MLIDKSDVNPPGKKLLSNMSTQTKWLLLAPVSLMLIGYGLCVFSEAGHLKHTGSPNVEWILLGTYSLILINGGISLFGQAVRYRILIDVRKETRRSIRKLETKFDSKDRASRNRERSKKRKSSTKTS